MRKLYKLPLLLILVGSAELLPGHNAFAQKVDPPAIIAKPARVSRPTINIRKFYDYRGSLRKNSIKIQPVALINALKVSYERVVLRKLSVGANVAFQHNTLDMGTTKFELSAKYFLRYRAPLGVYAYTSHGVANVQNHIFQYRYAPSEGEQQVLDPKTKLLVEQKANFSTYIGTIGLGFHNVIGPDRNIILDLGIGYQFYNVPDKYKSPVSRDGMTYTQFGENNSMIGPLSSLSTRFALGFMF